MTQRLTLDDITDFITALPIVIIIMLFIVVIGLTIDDEKLGATNEQP
jgi:hypothetical protein